MANWTASLEYEDGRPHEMTFYARDENQANAFVDTHLSFYGGRVHQIKKLERDEEDFDEEDFDEEDVVKPGARKTLGGY